MSNEIQKYCFSGIMQDGAACKSPELTVLSFEGVDISCIEGLCVSFSFVEGAEKHCITVQIDCHSCDCPPLIETKCFCDSADDCPNGCDYCSADGICVSNCPTGQVCDDSTCVDCLADGDCPCNQKCIQGKCACEDPGDIINNAGCCVDCVTNTDCNPCEVCINGNCEPKDCGTGHCNPITGNCDECYTNAHCGVNECCVGGECECCLGFYRDPLTGLCVIIPECFTSGDCKDCEDCVNFECVPRICPNDQICINDTCIDGCTDPDDCPTGYGCLNGQCVPCNTLSCAGTISFCEQALGCDCVDNTCTYVDCTILEDCVKWDVVRPTVIPGTPIPGTGLPAVSFNVTWQDLGIVTMPGGGPFRNYSFTITETTGAVGNYTVYGQSLGVGNSVTFELDDSTPIQWNNVGFEVEFTESLPGSRTASIVIINQNWYNGGNGFQEDLFVTPANWAVNVQADAIPPASMGGGTTPGSLTLCPCNPNAIITGWSWTTIEGNLTVTFSPLGDGCLRANVQGCGTGEGTVTIDCAGFVSTIPIPPLPFDYSSSTCCDPITDPSCPGNPGDGNPCNTVEVLNGTIVLSQFGSVTPSGAGLFRGVFQPSSVGISAFDWIRASRNGVCWSTTGTMISMNTFAIPNLPFAFHDVEYTLGAGCLQMGHTCSIRIGLCKEVQAEVCLNGCEGFTVSIVRNGDVLTAVTSLGNAAQLLYNWYENETPSVSGPYPDYNADGNNSTYTLPNPNSTINFMTVNVKISVNGVSCFDQDIEIFNLDILPGCRNSEACNYDSSATADGACCYLDGVTYSCSSGLLIPNTCPGVDYFVLGSPNINYTHPGLYLAGNTLHTVIGMVSGEEVCRTTITAPQCYRCVTGECVAAPAIANLGEFTNDPSCGFTCGCNLNIGVGHTCVGNEAALQIAVTGGSGNYSVTVTNDIGTIIYGPIAVTDDAPIVTPSFCGADYFVIVNDVAGVPGACEPVGYHTNCFNCESSDTALNAYTNPFVGTIQYDCNSQRFIFSIIPDSCASFYDVTIKKNTDLNTVLATGHWGNLAVTTPTSMGLDDACNGDYTLTITDSNGCTHSLLATVDCDFCGDPVPDCPLISFDVSVFPDVLDYRFLYNLEIDAAAPSNQYLFEIFNTDNPTGPACGGNAVGSAIYSFVSIMPGGVYSGFLPVGDDFPYPSVKTCYIVRIRGNSPLPSDCRLEQLISVTPPTVPPTGCSLVSSSISTYNTVGQNFSLSWNFANSSGDITLEAVVWDSGTCGIGSSTTYLYDGLPAVDNNHPFPLAQIDGVAQCVEFHVFDTNNPACGTEIVERSVAACTCGVELTEVEYNSGLERIEISWEATCGTVPTGFTIEIIERSLIGCTGTTTLLDSYAVSTLSGLQYHDITAPGVDRYIEVVITDDTNAVCTDSACVVVTGCNDCVEQYVDIPAVRLNSLEDNNGNTYIIPSSVFFECVNTGDPSAVNDAAVLALENHLIALGDCGTPVVTWESIVADTTTCTHSSFSLNPSGTYPINFTGIDINGTLYGTSIQYATATGGNVSLVTTGNDLIEDFVVDSLTAEGIPFYDVQVKTSISGGPSGSVLIDIIIQGIDVTHVLEGFYQASGSFSDAFDTTGCADAGIDGTDGTCIRLTISGSGIIFDGATLSDNTYTFNTSGC